MSESIRHGGYALEPDRSYHTVDHTWAKREGDLVRVGMDDLGQATTGDVAHLALRLVGERVAHGDQLGTVEAQKFVGPLRSPVCGTIVAANETLAADPRLLNTDPYGAGWVALLRPSEHGLEDLEALAHGDAAVAWFKAEVERYRREGALAE